jgi:hypothetical protein
MSRSAFATLLLTTLLVACAASNPDGTSAGGGGKADGETTQITFAADWSEHASGDLVAGSPVRIVYDLDRLQDCRGQDMGSDVWGAGGYASFDGKEPTQFAVSRLDNGTTKPTAAEIEIPATAKSVDFWFASSNKWGCIAYDSNDSANYHFAVHPSPAGAVLAFDADGTESQSGAVKASSQLVVHYEPARLSQCAASSGGYAKWSVTMHYKVDGGTEKTLLVTRANGSDLEASDPAVTVPRGGDLELWFTATSVYGCNAYDSNDGANYHYSIE